MATASHVRPPTDELSGALFDSLVSAEGDQPFDPRDLCILTATALIGDGKRASVPAEMAPVLDAALAQLGVSRASSDKEIAKAIEAAVKARPVSEALLGALEGFRTEGLAAAQQRARAVKSRALFGTKERVRAPSVEAKPKLTAQQLLNSRNPGKTIIR